MVKQSTEIEYVEECNFLVCNVSYDHNRVPTHKFYEVQHMCGNFNSLLSNELRRASHLKFCKVIEAPLLIYRYEK
jgi:hypothetical protein